MRADGIHRIRPLGGSLTLHGYSCC